jgi:hypothetical protein
MSIGFLGTFIVGADGVVVDDGDDLIDMIS